MTRLVTMAVCCSGSAHVCVCVDWIVPAERAIAFPSQHTTQHTFWRQSQWHRCRCNLLNRTEKNRTTWRSFSPTTSQSTRSVSPARPRNSTSQLFWFCAHITNSRKARRFCSCINDSTRSNSMAWHGMRRKKQSRPQMVLSETNTTSQRLISHHHQAEWSGVTIALYRLCAYSRGNHDDWWKQWKFGAGVSTRASEPTTATA